MFPDSLIGVFICFGPLIVLAIAFFWLFNRLDTQWKNEAFNSQGLSRTSNQVVETPCWLFIGCPENQRENCPAYQNQEIPCWQHFRSPDGQVLERCLKCDVFNSAPIPAKASI